MKRAWNHLVYVHSARLPPGRYRKLPPKRKKQNVPFPEGILLRLQHSSLSFNSCQILLSNCRTYVIVYAWETREPQGGLPSFFGGATLQTTEEGGRCDDYIPGFFPVLYLRCHPYQSDLSDF